jgi:hypothetical protein
LREALRTRFPGVYSYGFPGERPFRMGERIGFYRRLYVCREARLVPASPQARGAWAWRARPIDWGGARPPGAALDVDPCAAAAIDPERAGRALHTLDRIWSRLGPLQPAPMVARTGAWLAWRYRDHPRNVYRVWRVERWFGQPGWLVTRAMPDGSVCVVDALLPRAADAAAACSVLRRALSGA